MKRSRIRIVEVVDTRMPGATRTRERARVSVGRDPASDQERVLEEDEGWPFAGRPVSLRCPIETNDGRQRDGSGRSEESDSDRRELAAGRSNHVRLWPLVVRDLLVAAVLRFDGRLRGLLFVLMRAAAFRAQEAVDPAAQHHLRRQVDQQQKGGRERRRFLPKAIPL